MAALPPREPLCKMNAYLRVANGLGLLRPLPLCILGATLRVAALESKVHVIIPGIA